MNSADRILKEIRAVLEQDTRVNIHHNSIEFGFRDGTLVLAGEVATVAAKKLAVEYAAALAPEVRIDDRLLVKPGMEMEDADLCDLVFAALEGESAFNDTSLKARVNGTGKAFRETPRGTPEIIELEVARGVITLSGQVESYAHKALAGTLAWWRRGTRNVINNLAVDHAMDDPDGEMSDALRMLLEKDRFVNVSQIRGYCHDFTAILTGTVGSEAEKGLAEADAWYLFGVKDVENRLVVV